MKRNKLIYLSSLAFITIIGLTLFTTSCKKEKVVVSNKTALVSDNLAMTNSGITELHNEPLFHHLMMKEYKLIGDLTEESVESIVETDIINSILSGDPNSPLSVQQKNDIAELFNFASYDDFFEYIEDMNVAASYLNNKYNLSTMSEADLQYEIYQYNPNGFGDEIYAEPTAEDCKYDYNICHLGVAGAALAMHAGCAAADMTVILGVACHAGVIAWSTAEQLKCNKAYNQCMGMPINQPGPYPYGYSIAYQTINYYNYSNF